MRTCDDCGLLAVKNRFTGELVAADREYRVTGEAPFIRREAASARGRFRSAHTYPYTNVPWCLAGSDLGRPFRGDDWGDPVEVISYLRSRPACLAFRPWDGAEDMARGAGVA